MRFPSIRDVAHELREINVEGECDVRLQVYPSGTWAIRVGSSDYDLDHRGYWGASCLPGTRCNTRDIAKDLISQCREMKEGER